MVKLLYLLLFLSGCTATQYSTSVGASFDNDGDKKDGLQFIQTFYYK